LGSQPSQAYCLACMWSPNNRNPSSYHLENKSSSSFVSKYGKAPPSQAACTLSSASLHQTPNTSSSTGDAQLDASPSASQNDFVVPVRPTKAPEQPTHQCNKERPMQMTQSQHWPCPQPLSWFTNLENC
jgi:hypothetical protein